MSPTHSDQPGGMYVPWYSFRYFPKYPKNRGIISFVNYSLILVMYSSDDFTRDT